MALDSLLIKVRSALTTVRSNIPASPRPSSLFTSASVSSDRLGVLAFEAASLMSKLLYLWRALSDAQLLRLHRHHIALPGVRKLVSDDDAFLLSLARAEFADTLRAAADAVSSLAARCADPSLRRFSDRFRDFADSGRDPERWSLTRKEMEAKAKKMDKYVAATASLYKQMDELAEREQYLRRLLHYSASAAAAAAACNDGAGPQKVPSGSVGKMAAVAEVQQKVLWQRQEVKHLKEASLWNRTFDSVVVLLARSAFTILARIKHVFYFPIPGCVDDEPPRCSTQNLLATPPQSPRPSSVARSLSQSALVHPSFDAPDLSSPSPTRSQQSSPRSSKEAKLGFFEANAAALAPPPGTLGAAGLVPRYANVIVILEKMVRSPRSIGPDARDDLYAMLPSSVRAALRARLRGVAGCAATDVGLAEEWRVALGKIAEWLAPLAHNTLRWQAERSFERRSAATAAAQRSGVLLLQTLHFACREKTEATVVELLVGLNYVWRFEMEMSAKAAAAAFFAAAQQGGGQLKESPPAEIVLDCNVSFT